MTDGKSQGQVVSAARFYIDTLGKYGRIAFSELGGINSKVASTEYIYNDAEGKTVHTKQFGKTEPPTVTLKRGLDVPGQKALMTWHVEARAGLASARTDVVLVVTDASGTQDSEIKYLLHGAWLSEMTVTSMKAGDSSVAMVEVKISCEQITIDGVPIPA